MAEGFPTINAIANANLSEFLKIEGFDEETSAELQNRAKAVSYTHLTLPTTPYV